MILYTIQHVDAYKNALIEGYLTSNEDYKVFPKEYNWMYDEYVKRCNIKERDSNKGLVWCWKDKPDLRRRGYHDRGTDLVLLKLNIDNDKVLASDFNVWHFVLNDWSVALNEEEEEYYFNLKSSNDVRYEEEKLKSWCIIFDIDLLKACDYLSGDTQEIQYVTGKVPISQVEVVRYFKAK